MNTDAESRPLKQYPVWLRPYHLIPTVVLLMYLVILVTIGIWTTGTNWSGRILGQLAYAFPFIFVAFLSWAIWGWTFFASADRQLRWRKTPLLTYRDLRMSVWGIPGAIAASSFILPLAAVIRILMGDMSNRDFPWSLTLSLLLIGMLLMAVSRAIWRVTKRRFMANLASRNLCFDCGYDLRGNPDATECPECGWAIAWKKAPPPE